MQHARSCSILKIDLEMNIQPHSYLHVHIIHKVISTAARNGNFADLFHTISLNILWYGQLLRPWHFRTKRKSKIFLLRLQANKVNVSWKSWKFMMMLLKLYWAERDIKVVRFYLTTSLSTNSYSAGFRLDSRYEG